MIRQRVISAAFVAVILIVAVLYVPKLWSVMALSLVLLAAAWEWSGFLAPGRIGSRLAFVACAAALSACWWIATGTSAGLHVLLWGACAFWCAAMAWVFTSPGRIGPSRVALSGLLALSFAWLVMARMRIDWQHGGHVVMYALLVVWLADSGAYFSGRAFGRRKLAPLVSPGKTWAGLWGGLAACAVLAVVTATLEALPLLPLLTVTLIAGVFSVVGDLTESLCKRYAGVKDSGSLIPGHGGVLDRFDSLLAALPPLMLGAELVPGLRG